MGFSTRGQDSIWVERRGSRRSLEGCPGGRKPGREQWDGKEAREPALPGEKLRSDPCGAAGGSYLGSACSALGAGPGRAPAVQGRSGPGRAPRWGEHGGRCLRTRAAWKPLAGCQDPLRPVPSALGLLPDPRLLATPPPAASVTVPSASLCIIPAPLVEACRPPVIVRSVSLWSRLHITATPGCIVCVSSRPGSTSKDAGLTALGPDSETPMHRQSGNCGLAQGSAGLLSALCHPRGLSPERVPCGHLESPALSTPTLPGQSLLSGQPGLAAARSPHWLSAALTITPGVPGPSLCTSHQPLWFLRPPCTVLFATPKHLGACGSHLLRSPSLPLPAPQH